MRSLIVPAAVAIVILAAPASSLALAPQKQSVLKGADESREICRHQAGVVTRRYVPLLGSG